MAGRINHRGFTGSEESAPRVNISVKMKADVIEMQSRSVNGEQTLFCSKCSNEIERGSSVEFNHIKAVFLGGKNTVDNLEALHPECHRKITNEQAAQFAKIRSVAGLTSKKAKLQMLRDQYDF